MIQLLAILQVEPARRASRVLLTCGLLVVAIGTTAARDGEGRVVAAQSSGEARLPRENLLVYRGPDGAKTRGHDRRLAPTERRNRGRDAGRDGASSRTREALSTRHEGRGRGRLWELRTTIDYLLLRAGIARACLSADSEEDPSSEGGSNPGGSLFARNR